MGHPQFSISTHTQWQRFAFRSRASVFFAWHSLSWWTFFSESRTKGTFFPWNLLMCWWWWHRERRSSAHQDRCLSDLFFAPKRAIFSWEMMINQWFHGNLRILRYPIFTDGYTRVTRILPSENFQATEVYDTFLEQDDLSLKKAVQQLSHFTLSQC